MPLDPATLAPPGAASSNTSLSRLWAGPHLPAAQLLQPAAPPDPALRLTQHEGALVMQLNDSVQALLGLKSSTFFVAELPPDREAIGGEPSEASALHNLTPGERRLRKKSNAALLHQFTEAFRGYDPRQRPAEVTPWQRLRGGVMFAFGYFPERAADRDLLARAFDRMEVFMRDYVLMLADLQASRPELADALREVGELTVASAQRKALAGADAYAELLTPAQLVERAVEWQARREEHLLLKDSRAFYEQPGVLEGSGAGAGAAAVDRLADGAVGFSDLKTLLRYGPVGRVHYERATADPSASPQRQVIYPDPLLVSLFYRQDGHRVTVEMTPDGYREHGGPLLPHPQALPMLVRSYHEEMILRQVIHARLRGLARG